MPRSLRLLLPVFILLAVLATPRLGMTADESGYQGPYAQAEAAYAERDWTTAAEYFRAAAAFAAETFGEHAPERLDALQQAAQSLRRSGNPEAAQDLVDTWLPVAREHLGPQDRVTFEWRKQAAMLIRDSGDWSTAGDRFAEILADQEAALGSLDEDTILTLVEHSLIINRLGQHAPSMSQLKDAIDRADEVGFRGKAYYMAKNSQALHYDRVDDLTSIEILEEAFEGAVQDLGPTHGTTMLMARNMAMFLEKVNRLYEAERWARKALELRRRLVNDDHIDLAQPMTTLARIMISLGRYIEAEELLLRAGRIMEQGGMQAGWLQGDYHSTLFTLYMQTSRYDEADSAAQRTYEHYVTTFDVNSTYALAPRSYLAIVNLRLGREEEARRHFRKNFEIASKSLPPDSLFLAPYLYHFGHSIYKQGRKDEGMALLSRAQELFEAHPESPLPIHAIALLLNLGNVLYLEGDFEGAEQTLEDALRRLRGIVFGGKPQEVDSLRSIANARIAQDKDDEALTALQEALSIVNAGIPDDLLRQLDIRRDLSAHYARIGQDQRIWPVLQSAFAIEREWIQRTLHILTEREKIDWVSKVHSGDIALSTVITDDSPQEQLRETWNSLLFRKGLVLDVLSDQRSIVENLGDQNITAAYDRLLKLRQEYAHVVVEFTGERASPEAKQHLDGIRDEIAKLEVTISRASDSFALQSKLTATSLSDVLERVPENTVLVDFYKYRDADLEQPRPENMWTGWRYGAFCYDGTKIHYVDIGDEEPLEAAIRTAKGEITRLLDAGTAFSREELRESYETANLFLKVLGERLLERACFDESTERMLIVTDGELSVLPFEVLRLPDGEYLGDRLEIQYLTTARDLVRYQMSREAPAETAMIMAAPDFEGSGEVPDISPSLAESAREVMESTMDKFVSLISLRDLECFELAARDFGPLPGSLQEAKRIRSDVRRIVGTDPVVLVGADATEERLRGIRRPRLLHIATHGYFLTECEFDEAQVNPLLYSGLVLSNGIGGLTEQETSSSTADGVLTAYEASQLDLRGTDLVVLSACETGLGKVEAGEGVFGLRRAFEHAGARTTVMSLWKVPDQETSELMDRYYRNLARGRGKLESLREARSDLRRRVRRRYGVDHPMFWAGFIGVGED